MDAIGCSDIALGTLEGKPDVNYIYLPKIDNQWATSCILHIDLGNIF